MSLRSVLPVACVLLAGVASAQTTVIYAFSRAGVVSANAYQLDDLVNSASSSGDEEWWDLALHGPDRWLIRGDGRISQNGELVDELSDDQDWRGLVVVDDGSYIAMSKGGRISDADGIVVDYTAGDFIFRDILTDGQTVYVLKSNGGVFRVPEPDPIVKFDGPPGEISGSDEDGEAPDTAWVRLLINPVDGHLWALRQDGTIKSAEVPVDPPVQPSEGLLEAGLPYDDGDDSIDIDELYSDLTFDSDGTWYALRGDGKLYTVKAQGPPLVDLPGEPSDDGDDTYASVIVLEGQTLVLRADGRIYRDLDTESVIDLKGNAYERFVIGDELPDLTNVKNKPPVASSMTIVAPEGADVEVPIVVTDRDKPAADLIVDVVPETLPAGATWDGVTRTISWPAAGPVGSYKIKITVDDGIAKPVTAKQTITIKPLDVNRAKNIKPFIAKVKKAVALVALPFELEIFAFDRDGDALTLSIDDSKPLPEGAAFDDVTGLFTWDAPVVNDKGTKSFKFFADDGTVQVNRTIKVKVETSLLGF